jgi:hypothetical protein
MGTYSGELNSHNWKEVDYYSKLIEVEKRITQYCSGCHEKGGVLVNHFGGWQENVIDISCCYCDYRDEESGYNKYL